MSSESDNQFALESMLHLVGPVLKQYPTYDLDLVRDKSKHYIAYIHQQPCFVAQLTGVPQKSRTTAHHIVSKGLALKCSDFLTMPVEETKHLDFGPDVSIEGHGKSTWLSHYGIESYDAIVMLYLGVYLTTNKFEETIYKDRGDGVLIRVEPTIFERDSAVYNLHCLAQNNH